MCKCFLFLFVPEGNIPLHLAASMGQVDATKCLIEDGSNLLHRNDFGLLPVDVAHPNCREMVKEASLVAGPGPAVTGDLRAMHESHVQKYFGAESALTQSLDGYKMGTCSEHLTIENVRSQIEEATYIGISPDVIAAGWDLLGWMEDEKNLVDNIEALRANAPILTEDAYCEFVYKLQMTIRRVNGQPLPSGQGSVRTIELVGEGQALIDRSHAEFGLHGAHAAASKIGCADDEDEPTMDRLGKFLERAGSVGADAAHLRDGRTLRDRLEAEVQLRSRLARLPTDFRLPVEGMTNKEAKQYWQESDIGHIKRTPEYPNPPPSAEGETETSYVWIPSDSLRALRDAIKCAREAFVAAKNVGTGDDYLLDFEIILKEKEEARKTLEEKDAEDREAEEVIARKAAKRLRAKGRKKKKTG